MLASPYTYKHASTHKISSSSTPSAGGNRPIVRPYPHSRPLPTYRPRVQLVAPHKQIEPQALVPMMASPPPTDSDSEFDCPCDGGSNTPSSCSSSDSVDAIHTKNTTASSRTAPANRAREEDAKFFNLLAVHPDEFQDIADLLLARRRLGGTDNRFYVERRLALFLCVAAQGLTGQAACVACRAYGLDPAALEATMHAVAEALASLDLAPSGAGQADGIGSSAAGALTGFHTTLDSDAGDTPEGHKRQQRHQPEVLAQSRKSYVLMAQDLATGLFTGVSAGHAYVDSADDMAAVFQRDTELQPPAGQFYLGTSTLPMVEGKIMTPCHPRSSGIDGGRDRHGSSARDQVGKKERSRHETLFSARRPADHAREEFFERFPVVLGNQFPLETQMPLMRALAVINNTLVSKRRCLDGSA